MTLPVASVHQPARAITFPLLVVGVLVFTAAVALLLWRTIGVLNIPGDPLSGAWGMQDFRDAVYYPVRAVLDGVNPYNTPLYMERYPVGQHFPLYSPLFLALNAVFGVGSFEVAQWIYFASIVFMYLVMAWMCVRFTGWQASTGVVLIIAAVLLMSRPGYMNLTVGQLGAQLGLASLIAIHFAERRPWIAAIAIAILSIKVTWFVPLLILLWVRGNRSACIKGSLLAIVLTILPLLYVVHVAGGWEPFIAAIPGNLEMFSTQSNPLINFTRIDAMGLLRRATDLENPLLSDMVAITLVLGLASLALLAANRRHQQHRPLDSHYGRDGVATPEGLLIIFAMMFCCYHQPYELLILVLPAICMVLTLRKSFPVTSWVGIGLICLSVAGLALNYLSSHTFVPLTDHYHWMFPVLGSLNGLLLMVGFAGALAINLRPEVPNI